MTKAITALRRILLAEDDPRDVEFMLEVLGGDGLAKDVDVVGDGEEVLDYVYRRGRHGARPAGLPAVLVLDLKMPKVDGVEVARNIKGDPVTRALPIVVFTSSRESRDIEACYRLGVNAYVVKPVRFADYVAAIRRIGAFWARLNGVPARLEGGR